MLENPGFSTQTDVYYEDHFELENVYDMHHVWRFFILNFCLYHSSYEIRFTSMPMNLPWRIIVNQSREQTDNYQHNHNSAKERHICVHIYEGC